MFLTRNGCNQELVSGHFFDPSENFEISIPEELKDSLVEGKEIEYWDLEGVKVMKKVMN